MTTLGFIILWLLFGALVCVLHARFAADVQKKMSEIGMKIDYPLQSVSYPPKSEVISTTLNSDDYLTAEQVAAMLQVSKGTIYTWANDGYIPALKIRGGSQKNVWRFSRKDVEAWIAEQKQPVTAKDLFAQKESNDESAGT